MKTNNYTNHHYVFLLIIVVGLFIQSCSVNRYMGLQEASPEQVEAVQAIVIPVVPEPEQPVSAEVRSKTDEYLSVAESELSSRLGRRGRMATTSEYWEAVTPSYAIMALLNDDFLLNEPDKAEQVIRVIYHEHINNLVRTLNFSTLESFLNSVSTYYAVTQQASQLIAMQEAQISLGDYFDYYHMRFLGEAGIAAYAANVGDQEMFIKRALRAADHAESLMRPNRAFIELQASGLGQTYDQAINSGETWYNTNEYTEMLGYEMSTERLFPLLVNLYREAVYVQNEDLITRLTEVIENGDVSGRGYYLHALGFASSGDFDRSLEFVDRGATQYGVQRDLYSSFQLDEFAENQQIRSGLDAQLAESLLSVFNNPSVELWGNISEYTRALQIYETEWNESIQPGEVAMLNPEDAQREQDEARAQERWQMLANHLDVNLTHDEVIEAYIPFLQSKLYDAGPFLYELMISGNIDIDMAIALYAIEVDRMEGARAGVNPDDRTRMFESSVADSRYNGLMKALTLRNAENDAERLLAVSEMARSRQLKELLSGSASLSFQSAATLDDPLGFADRVQGQLSDGDVAISYSMLPGELIAIVATHNGVAIERAEITDDLFREISGLHNSFSDPLSTDYRDFTQRVSPHIVGLVEHHIVQAQHLYILPDGLMNTIPFSSLQLSGGTMLVEENMTMSVLPTMEWLMIDTPSDRAAARNLFAVADPDYPTITIPRTGGGSATIEIPALPEAREEVDIISGIFEGNLLSLYGNEATKEQVINADLSQFSHLHFATHGILANEVPGVYEPALILAGETQNDDSFLTASDVEQLSINADVCVLSACNTGSGEVLRGEGVLGLSRSFMVAGCNSVVVSLWPVASDVTRDLMVAFYQAMADGESASGAMRQAQLDVFSMGDSVVETTRAFKISRTGDRQDEQISTSGNHPFFWAPFIVVGAN